MKEDWGRLMLRKYLQSGRSALNYTSLTFLHCDLEETWKLFFGNGAGNSFTENINRYTITQFIVIQFEDIAFENM